MTHSIKSLKKSLSKISILFFTLSFLQSCALSPGMAPTDITDEEFFNNLELTFHKIEEVNFEDLPNQSEKYKKDVKNLQELVQDNRYRYILGSGDIINVNLVDNDEINGDFTIDAEGYISLPYADKILVKDLTKLGAERLISEVLEEYYQEPQIIIDIKEFKSRYTYITGEVVKPQSILLTDKPLSILDAIIQAGYIKDQKSFDKKALLKRKEELYTIDLYELLNEINIEKNIFLREDDIVHIQKKSEDAVYVFGEAGQGTYPLYQNSTLTKLLSNAKINQITADTNRIYIIRENLKKPFHGDVYELNAQNPTALIYANKFNLLPQDVIFVSPSDIVRWNRVISLITPQSGIFTTYKDINQTIETEF